MRAGTTGEHYLVALWWREAQRKLKMASTLTLTAGNRGLTRMFRLLARNFQTGFRRPNKDGFDEAWLEVLACPLSKAPLRYDAARQELVCDQLMVAYPIINGIPNLVPTDARKLNDSASSPEGST